MVPTGDAAKKLSESKVREMRGYYTEEGGGYSVRDIAVWYGVSSTTAWKVVTYRAWKHVERCK